MHVIGKIFTIAGIGINKSDTLEGSWMSGCMRHNADCGCRMCVIPRLLYDSCEPGEMRTVPMDLAVRSLAASENSGISLQMFGLNAEGPPLSGIAQDHFRQTPFDPFHMEFMGIAKQMFSSFCSCLRAGQIDKLNSRIQSIVYPSHWVHLPPIVEMSGAGSDKGTVKGLGHYFNKWFQIITLAFRNWLREDQFKASARTNFEARLGQMWLSKIKQCFIKQGLLHKELFRSDHDANSVDNAKHIHTLTQESRKLFVEVFGLGEERVFKNSSNVHGGCHHSRTFTDCGGNRHADCARSETRHGPLKARIQNTNHTSLAKDIMIDNNVIQAMKFYAAGGYNMISINNRSYSDDCESQPMGEKFKAFLRSSLGKRLSKSKSGKGTATRYDDASDSDSTIYDSNSDEDNIELSQAPATSHIVFKSQLDILQHQNTGTVTCYREAIMPNRERWRRRVAIGEFYKMKQKHTEQKIIVQAGENGAVRREVDRSTVTDVAYVSSVCVVQEHHIVQVPADQDCVSQQNDIQDGVVRRARRLRKASKLILNQMVEVRWAYEVNARDQHTGFRVYVLSEKKSMVEIEQIASPLHLLHLCDHNDNQENCAPVNQARHESDEDSDDWLHCKIGMRDFIHDAIRNPYYLRNECFWK